MSQNLRPNRDCDIWASKASLGPETVALELGSHSSMERKGQFSLIKGKLQSLLKGPGLTINIEKYINKKNNNLRNLHKHCLRLDFESRNVILTSQSPLDNVHI